jgi:carboxypeptidase Taq
MTALDTLRTQLQEVSDLRRTADLLDWDERVCMPNGGAPAHGEMLATIRRLAHQAFTSSAFGDALEAAAALTKTAAPDSDDRRLVEVTARDYEKAVRVPDAFVAEHARVISAAQQAWADARARNDFPAFRPHLERVIALKRDYVSFFERRAHPYDVLLDDYEPGMTTAEVQQLFGELRPKQIALIQTIKAKPEVDDRPLRAALSETDLEAFAREVVTAFGFDWTRGRLDKSLHPFATSIGADDVRMTTRFVEHYPFSLLFGVLHETGHALYEQGIDPAYARTTLEGGTSLGIHESQSRLWENIVGRSLAFWEHFYSKLQARFPALRSVPLREFYRGINKVEPSLIRVEADEATYNLHVMLRVELEIALTEGTLEAAELPDRWSRSMQEYLGVRPDSDTNGVLQDIHWSAGLFGYFATYTVGNVVSAQLWDRFGSVHPDRDADVRRGEFGPLLAWLRREVHRHGRKFEPQDLLQRATGSRIDPAPYLQYLETKYATL